MREFSSIFQIQSKKDTPPDHTRSRWMGGSAAHPAFYQLIKTTASGRFSGSHIELKRVPAYDYDADGNIVVFGDAIVDAANASRFVGIVDDFEFIGTEDEVEVES